MSSRRGQALVLLALTLLLITLMVCMTLSFGWTAARRTDLNNVADATALSEAVATARTFNGSAILNRAMVAHYVAQAGISAQMVYATRGQQYMFQAGYQMRLYDFRASNGPIVSYAQIEAIDNLGLGGHLIGGCVTGESRAASYELWHRAYWFYRTNSGSIYSGDNTNSACDSSGNCTQTQGFNTPEGVAQLEEEAAKQAHATHQAIWDLAEMQRNTLLELKGAIADDGFLRSIATRANVPAAAPGTPLARSELADATGSTSDLQRVDESDLSRYKSWRDPMGSAILGSRPRRTPLFLPADMGEPSMRENFAPLWRNVLAVAQAGLAAANPNFSVRMEGGDTSGDTTENAQVVMPSQREEPLDGALDTGLLKMSGRFREGVIATTYNDCRGSGLRRTASGSRVQDPVSNLVMELPPVEDLIVSFKGGGGHPDGIHMLFGRPAGCHATHEHYGATVDGDRIHRLGDDEGLYPLEALGFVLPDQGVGARGARGAWGQPKLPVLLTQARPALSDPFNLTVGLRLDSSGPGARFDMKRAIDMSVTSAAGMAYYHRRGHLGEPPNMLNPFWRAALVPMEIDERSQRDPTQASQGATPTMRQALGAVGSGYRERADARNAYDRLSPRIDGMELAPERN